MIPVEFKPTIRSGVWFDIGPRSVMEDEHVVIDNLVEHLGSMSVEDSGSYYGVSELCQLTEACRFIICCRLN